MENIRKAKEKRIRKSMKLYGIDDFAEYEERGKGTLAGKLPARAVTTANRIIRAAKLDYGHGGALWNDENNELRIMLEAPDHTTVGTSAAVYDIEECNESNEDFIWGNAIAAEMTDEALENELKLGMIGTLNDRAENPEQFGLSEEAADFFAQKAADIEKDFSYEQLKESAAKSALYHKAVRNFGKVIKDFGIKDNVQSETATTLQKDPNYNDLDAFKFQVTYSENNEQHPFERKFVTVAAKASQKNFQNLSDDEMYRYFANGIARTMESFKTPESVHKETERLQNLGWWPKENAEIRAKEICTVGPNAEKFFRKKAEEIKSRLAGKDAAELTKAPEKKNEPKQSLKQDFDME